MQVNVADYKFTVNVLKGAVELMHNVRNEIETKRVIDALKTVYGDEFVVNIRINRSGKYKVVVIPTMLIERYNDIREQVIQVLCRKLEKTKDEKKRRIIIKHLIRLAPAGSCYN